MTKQTQSLAFIRVWPQAGMPLAAQVAIIVASWPVLVGTNDTRTGLGQPASGGVSAG